MIAVVRAACVVACLVACGPSPTVIVAHTDVSSIALDATMIYWTSYDGVYAAPKAGKDVTPTKLASLTSLANGLVGIAVDESYVYFADPGMCLGTGSVDGAVRKVPLGGGTPTTLAAMQSCPQGVAIDADMVYWATWTTNGAILKVPKAGGSISAVSVGEMNPLAITVDTNSVYWTDYSAIRTANKVNGSALTLAAGSHGIAVDATSAYFAEYNGPDGSVMKVSLAGGTPTVLAKNEYNSPKWVAVDASHVYWADQRYIQRATLDGARTEQLLDEQWYVTAIAIDDAFIYWGNDQSNSNLGIGLRRIAK